MYEKNMMRQGRIPQAPGEIVVGKDFFLQNPAYKIGDILTLEVSSQKSRDTSNASQRQKKDMVSLTIVGEMDVSVSSGYEGYLAYGFMEPDKLDAASEVAVYLQMNREGKCIQQFLRSHRR